MKFKNTNDNNKLNSGIDDVITEEECQKIVADAIKQNADEDQEDLTAYPSFPMIYPDHDLKVNRQCCINRCTNPVNEDNYYHRLAGKCTISLQLNEL